MPSVGYRMPQNLTDIPTRAHSSLSGIGATDHHEYPVPTAGIKEATLSYSGSLAAAASYNLTFNGTHVYRSSAYADADDVCTSTVGVTNVKTYRLNGIIIVNNDVVAHTVTLNLGYMIP